MRLGFIVNPVAGMGGKVGLKGTDDMVKEALKKGAQPIAPARAIEFLKRLKENNDGLSIEVLTCPGIMGKYEAEVAAYSAQTLRMKAKRETSAEDTKKAVRLLAMENADIIVFVGGDGTAKDVFDALQGLRETLVLGVPSGVKMYSGVFAVNSADAVETVLAFARKQVETAEFEIIDANENSIRNDSFELKLHGYLRGPFLPAHVQGSKQMSPDTADEKDNQTAIAKFVIEERPAEATWILGPGTSVKCVAELLGVEKTLLGVDIYKDGRVILDVDEQAILSEVQGNWERTWIVVSPIGHQGIIFGRGNQQISPEIIKRVGRKRIIIIATKNKLRSMANENLRVDTGDEEADEILKGYMRVVTDYREWRLMRVE